MIKCNSLSINESVLKAALRPYILQAFTEAEDKLLDLMEKEVMRTVHGNGPGKPAWRSKTRSALKLVEEMITDDYLEAKVGFDANAAFTDFVKAMLISEGAGSAAGGEAIHAGPPGRSVWDDNLDGKHPSNAKSEYDMPSGFNQPGNHFVANAVKLMKKHYDDIIANLASSIPSSVFASAVIVSAG